MNAVSVLGPLQIRIDGKPTELKGRIQQTLLITLVVAEGSLVSVDALVDELWDEAPPAGVENALHAHVSRLRRRIAAWNGEAGAIARSSSAHGYRLDVPAAQVDARTFLSHLGEARRTAESDPEAAVRSLRAGLALWRGAPMGGGRLCRTAAVRYEESRTTAQELLFDLELRLGRHAAVVAELTELVSDARCLNERLCEQAMVSLYRSGRQGQALALCRAMRERLDAELGVRPGPSLRALERAVLDHDPLLQRESTVLEPSALARAI